MKEAVNITEEQVITTIKNIKSNMTSNSYDVLDFMESSARIAIADGEGNIFLNLVRIKDESIAKAKSFEQTRHQHKFGSTDWILAIKEQELHEEFADSIGEFLFKAYGYEAH